MDKSKAGESTASRAIRGEDQVDDWTEKRSERDDLEGDILRHSSELTEKRESSPPLHLGIRRMSISFAAGIFSCLSLQDHGPGGC